MDENHIELLETELYALQGRDLNLVEINDQEERVGEMDEAVRRRL